MNEEDLARTILEQHPDALHMVLKIKPTEARWTAASFAAAIMNYYKEELVKVKAKHAKEG